MSSPGIILKVPWKMCCGFQKCKTMNTNVTFSQKKKKNSNTRGDVELLPSLKYQHINVHLDILLYNQA